jgi:hypothetical protein
MRNVLQYLRFAVPLTLQFAVIYGGINWLTQYRADVHRIHVDWELSIPLVPAMIWVYASIAVLMVLPAFYLDRDQLRRLAQRLALAMLIAGGVFLAYPGQVGYAPVDDLPAGITLLRRIDLPYNVLPSLHVALSAIIIAALFPVFGTRGRLVLGAWLPAMVASVLLTHQHHVADVAGAAVLAWLCRRLVPEGTATTKPGP